MTLASHCLMSCIGNRLYSVKVQKERNEIQVATRMSAHAARNYYEMSRSCPRSVGLWRVLRTGCDLHRWSLVRRRRRRCDRTGIINGKILRMVGDIVTVCGRDSTRTYDRKVERLFVLPSLATTLSFLSSIGMRSLSRRASDRLMRDNLSPQT